MSNSPDALLSKIQTIQALLRGHSTDEVARILLAVLQSRGMELKIRIGPTSRMQVLFGKLGGSRR
jgi:hypothetical protein